jgi:ABC-type dipeptide/oligopeptide/nickel transport system ATPase component
LLTLALITHDMGVVAELADRVLVMHSGRIVEEGPVSRLLDCPQHPYTQRLLAAVPRWHRDQPEVAAR